METIKNSKLIKYTLIGGGAFLILLALATGGYVLYSRQEKEMPTERTQQEYPEKNIPNETIIEEKPDGSVDITPSQEETIQIQDEQGTTVDIPKLTPPSLQ